MEFHHIDETNKSFSISETAFSKSLDELKKEVDKCMLVCANCHRELHAEKEKEKLDNYAEYQKYRNLKRYAYSKIDKKTVEDLISEGKKQKEISEIIGVSVATLKRFLSENGMSKKRS